MKKTIIAILITSGFLSASSVSENLAYSETISKQPLVQPIKNPNTIGHFTFKVGPTTSQQNYERLVPTFGIGYQSRIVDSTIFHSTMIEFSGAVKEKTTSEGDIETCEFESLYYYPKVMGIHYWNRHSENRVFTSIGANICNSVYSKNTNPYPNWEAGSGKYSSQTTIGSSFACGIEMGPASEAVNILKLEFDQPFVEIFSDGDMSFLGSLTISYVVGF